MASFFHIVFYQPILNALIGLYAVLPVHDLGLAIILLTIIIRVLLYPLSSNAFRSQAALRVVQPKIQELRKRFKGDPQRMTKETMALYREHHIRPLGGLLPILVQLPILFALFRALRSSLAGSSELLVTELYSFVPHPASLSTHAFGGLFDLTAHMFPLALVAGAAQFFQSSLAMQIQPKSAKKGDFSSMMAVQMRYVFPIMTVFIVRILPAGIALYWVVTTLFSIVQQLQFNAHARKAQEKAEEDSGLVREAR